MSICHACEPAVLIIDTYTNCIVLNMAEQLQQCRHYSHCYYNIRCTLRKWDKVESLQSKEIILILNNIKTISL